MNRSMVVTQQAVMVRPHRDPSTVGWREVMETWLDATSSSPATRVAYSRALTGMFEWLTAATVWEVDAQILARYRAALMGRMDDDEAPLAPATVALKLNAARSFFRFAVLVGASPLRTEVVEMTLATFRHQVVRPYEVLNEKEQRRLLAWMRDNRPERDVLMVELMLAVGLRVREVVRLRAGDLVRDEEQDVVLRVRMGKGRKDRVVPLPQALARRLVTLVDDGAVFQGRQGNDGLTVRRVQQIVAECVRGAQLERRISPHSLRHTCAITMLRRDVPLVVVQKVLGHASLKTTQRYLDHIQMRELKEAVGR